MFKTLTQIKSQNEITQQNCTMNRRSFLIKSAAAALIPLASHSVGADPVIRRVRPADANWPSAAAWKRLNDSVGGNLIRINSPLTTAVSDPAERATLFANIKNPYYLGDHPGLTQTLGWVDAWTSQPSVYAVAARNASDVAAAVRFARENNLRLVVKGGGHSYQGTSNVRDSLLIWTRHLHEVVVQDNFVPQNCPATHPPQRAVTVGSGAYWFQAYDAVTTKAGAYVQGGGCTTVGVAGLIQSGGFGSFSKHYGTAASGLLEAEVVTADGQIRIANAGTNADLFWALKGGGGGTFAAITKLTLRVRDLPEFAGGASFNVKANSDAAYRRLLRRFIAFYRDALFNHHWGEQARFSKDNTLAINLVHLGLTTQESQRICQPFLDWLKQTPADYTLQSAPVIGSLPARHWWDVAWRKEHKQDVFKFDSRAGGNPGNAWWNGDSGQVGWVISGFESLWMPESLLQDDSQEKLANAIFAASRSRKGTVSRTAADRPTTTASSCSPFSRPNSTIKRSRRTRRSMSARANSPTLFTIRGRTLRTTSSSTGWMSPTARARKASRCSAITPRAIRTGRISRSASHCNTRARDFGAATIASRDRPKSATR